MKKSLLCLIMLFCVIITSNAAFSDIEEHWAKEYILSAGQSGLVNGFGDNTYRPDETLTRAQFVTILWRNAGSPESTVNCVFTDVSNDTYYSRAVIWAQENNIVNGVGNNLFNPDGFITREQAATVFYRMNGDSAWLMFSGIYDKAFTDSAKVSPWAKDAIYWSIYREIWCGTNSEQIGDTLSANQNMTRGQAAVMLVRFQKHQEAIS